MMEGAEQDVSSTFTLANIYHYSIIEFKQDLKTSLKYDEISGDAGSWEAADQVGKFHILGMFVKEGDRYLNNLYQ